MARSVNRKVWVFLVGACACACTHTGPKPVHSDPPGRESPGTEATKDKPNASPEDARTETEHQVFCLDAPAEPAPACAKSRTLGVPLPLRRAAFVKGQAASIEVGGLAPSAREPGRADHSDAAFVQVERGRIAKFVRGKHESRRAAFLDQAGPYRLHSEDHALSFWRSDSEMLELVPSSAQGARLLELGTATPGTFAVAYERVEASESKGSTSSTVSRTSVRVTSGPPSEWQIDPWRSLIDASSPGLVHTPRGTAFTALAHGSVRGAPSLVVEWLPNADGSQERFAINPRGLSIESLGGVALVGEGWITAAAYAPVPSEPRSCTRPVALPAPPSQKFDEAFSGRPRDSGGVALVSVGPKGSKSVVLEANSAVTPGYLALLDEARVAFSFCTQLTNNCYLAVLSLEEGSGGVLCSTASGVGPSPIVFDGVDLWWVENGQEAVQLNSAAELAGLALTRSHRE